MQMGSKQKEVVIISKIVEDLINEEKIANYFDLTLEEVKMLEKELTQVV